MILKRRLGPEPGLKYRPPVIGRRAQRPRGWLAALAALLLGACDARNPAAISRTRHPDYYQGSEDAPAAVSQPAPRRSERQRREPKRSPPQLPSGERAPPPDFADLAADSVVIDGRHPDGPGVPLDIAAARSSGALQIEINDFQFEPRLNELFDGDTGSLSRSEEVNPLVLDFHFQTPIRLAGARVFPSYSTYDWALKAAPEQPLLVVREAADKEWSRINLTEPIETSQVRLEVRRLVRDDYVHLNEVELLIEAPPDPGL
jgi:hypothetical protein